MSGMTPEKDDSPLLSKAKQSIGQLDAKRNLYIMSRRPFSIMQQEIKDCKFCLSDEFSRNTLKEENYNVAFDKIMENNKLFKNVPDNFCKACYGEQFFENEGKPKNLESIFSSKRKEDFVELRYLVFLKWRKAFSLMHFYALTRRMCAFC